MRYFFPFLFVLILLPKTVSAAIYTFVDETGVVHFTNVPSDNRFKLFLGEERHRGKFDQYIRRAADRFGVDPLLVKAVIKIESDFNHKAISNKGAKGLMQLMPDTINDMDVRDPFSPRENINGGTRYLGWLLQIFEGDVELALAGYNAGPNRVRELGRIPRIPETRRYVKKVISTYRRLKAEL